MATTNRGATASKSKTTKAKSTPKGASKPVTKKAAKSGLKGKPTTAAKKTSQSAGSKKKPAILVKTAKKDEKNKPVDKKKGQVIPKTSEKKISKAPAVATKTPLKPQTVQPKPSAHVKANKNEKAQPKPSMVNNIERGSAFGTKVRPQAILQKKNNSESMAEEKLKYSEEELKEFEVIIMEKLEKAKHELNYMKEMLSKKNDEGTDNTAGTMKLLEDGADTLEKENFSQLAARQQKFVTQLENAMARIKNGTYGICIETGKLIPKERLRAVPHTQHSIEAKLNRKD
jgi:RNA polymerase-binding transcription factor DksA